MQRIFKLALLAWCLGLAPVAANTRGESRGLLSLFLGAALGSLHRHSRELPSVALLAGLTLAMTLTVCVILPPYKYAARLKACDHNLKGLAIALEMYSTDNWGRYPLSLAPLCPNYLRTIPRCPAAQKDSYAYVVVAIPDEYTVVCAGGYQDDGVHPPDFLYHSTMLRGLRLP